MNPRLKCPGIGGTIVSWPAPFVRRGIPDCLNTGIPAVTPPLKLVSMMTSGLAVTACWAELVPPCVDDCESKGPTTLICRPSMPPLALICAIAVNAPALPGLTVEAIGPVRSVISANVNCGFADPPPPIEAPGSEELEEQAVRADASNAAAAIAERRLARIVGILAWSPPSVGRQT